MGRGTNPKEGVMKEEKFPHSRKSSDRHVCGELWNLRGQHNWEGEKKPTEYMPNHNYKRRWTSGLEAHVCHQKVRARRAGAGCIISP